jgi:hypothetical protein
MIQRESRKSKFDLWGGRRRSTELHQKREMIPKNETRTEEATWTIDETSYCKWDTSELSQITLKKMKIILFWHCSSFWAGCDRER